MNKIELSKILQDRKKMAKAIGLSYMGLGLYLAMKEKPKIIKKREEESFRTPRRKTRTAPRTLGDMIAKMIEEAYGIEET